MLPLTGVTVVGIEQAVAAPFATRQLADLGARVIKIERPDGGDFARGYDSVARGLSAHFVWLNRSKESLTLDLKQPAARDALLALARGADALVYNIRPQAMARLRLAYEDLRAVNGRILYVGAFGYSQRGPYAARPAYDDLIQGAAGIPWLHQAAGNESPRYTPLITADRTIGLQLANAVMAALFWRERSGRGQRIDVPMFEGMLQVVLGEHLGGYTFDPPVGGPGYVRLLARDRRPYATRDGYVCALIYNDKQWRAFLELVGRGDLLSDDARFATHQARAQNYDAAYAFVADEMRKRSTEEWLGLLERADIPVQRMNSIDDIVRDPHLAAIGYFETVEHPSEGRLRSLKVPSEWSETAPGYRRHAPRLGEHTREVLAEAGLAAEAIDALLARGAARAA